MIPSGLQEADDELANWARWGRDHAGPGAMPPPSIWDAWLNFKGRIAGWGLTAAEKEAEARGERVELAQESGPPPIDETDALCTDANMAWLMRHDQRTFAALHKHYYRWQRVSDLEMYRALRAYSDRFHSNVR